MIRTLLMIFSMFLLVSFTNYTNLKAKETSITKLTIASMFSDHMVLQREMPVPIWGKAKPGSEISLSFENQKLKTKADVQGRWKITLSPLKANSNPQTMLIESGEKIVIKDILIGEVWVCSGQSNMQYGWGKKSQREFNWGGDKDLKAISEEAEKLPIRHYFVPMNVSLKEEENCGGKWLTKLPGSAVAFSYSYHLQKKLGVPVATIVTCWGSSFIEGWMPLDMTNTLPHFKEMMEKFNKNDKKKIQDKISKGIRSGDVYARTRPNILYNAMLHPVIPYACRGFVWYQGEANANQYEQYKTSLPLWVKRLRESWQQDKLTFYGVMLPGYSRGKNWPKFRESQFALGNLEDADVINTIDLGEGNSIHPPDKEPIGRRLAQMALRDIHQDKMMGQGPLVKECQIINEKVHVSFKYGRGLKSKDGAAIRTFQLQDQMGGWHEAIATIQDNMVTLQSEKVKAPRACRYAFSPKPDVNLINEEGQPAYPFVRGLDGSETPSKTQLHKIAFGACAYQTRPQPIWDTVVAQNPDLFLFLGDNIYGDTKNMSVLKKKYGVLQAKPGYQKLLKTCPILSTWDDHDYGKNDGGSEYSMRKESAEVFLDFFNVPKDSPRRTRDGVYGAKMFGKEGQRVQVILLDTRYFRSTPLIRNKIPGQKKKEKNIVGWYIPTTDTNTTILGAEQWAWLEKQLKQKADLRIIASSIQVISQDKGMECWGNFPHERKRLFDLIKKTKANGTLFVSGDVHFSEVSIDIKSGPYPLYDFTSSGMTNNGVASWAKAVNSLREGDAYAKTNFGLITIDWLSKRIIFETKSLEGKTVIKKEIAMNDLIIKD